LFRGVIASTELFTPGEYSQHCRISVRYPTTKRVSTDEDNHSSQETLEEVENGNCPDTHEIEESPLDTQIRERFVQAFEDSVPASIVRFLHDDPRF
jgi:hypothetical protein